MLANERTQSLSELHKFHLVPSRCRQNARRADIDVKLTNPSARIVATERRQHSLMNLQSSARDGQPTLHCGDQV